MMGKHISSGKSLKSSNAARSASPDPKGKQALLARKSAAQHRSAIARKSAFLNNGKAQGLTNSNPGSLSADLYAVASDGTTIFAAVGRDNNNSEPLIATSPDGNTWNCIDVPDASASLEGVGFVNGSIIVVGYEGGDSSSGLIIVGVPSGNGGYNWGNEILTKFDDEYYCVGANASGVIIGGETYNSDTGWSGQVLFDTLADLQASNDPGGNLISVNPGSTVTNFGEVLGITFANGKLVLVGNGSNNDPASLILTSTDNSADGSGLSASWTSQEIASNNSLTGVTYGGAGFVAVSESGLVLTSPNCISWSVQSWPSGNFTSVAWGPMNGGIYGISNDWY